jgi:hypothetical protein
MVYRRHVLEGVVGTLVAGSGCTGHRRKDTPKTRNRTPSTSSKAANENPTSTMDGDTPAHFLAELIRVDKSDVQKVVRVRNGINTKIKAAFYTFDDEQVYSVVGLRSGEERYYRPYDDLGEPGKAKTLTAWPPGFTLYSSDVIKMRYIYHGEPEKVMPIPDDIYLRTEVLIDPRWTDDVEC